MLQNMLPRGADINVQDPLFGYTALHWAVEAGSFKNVQYLLQSGADLNIKSNEWQQTPLQLAQERGHSEIVTLLMTPKRSSCFHEKTISID